MSIVFEEMFFNYYINNVWIEKLVTEEMPLPENR